MEEKKNSLTVQQSRLTDEEKGLLQITFANNEALLLGVRNLFFGLSALPGEYERVREAFKDHKLRVLMRKILLPELQSDIPIGQSIDLWMTVKSDDKVALKARVLLIEMLEDALESLKGAGKKVDLRVKTTDPVFILARNTFIGHTELQLNSIKFLANEKVESEEQKLTKRELNSAK